MHECRVAIFELQAIRTDVAIARFRVSRENLAKGDELTRVLRPTLQDRELGQVDVCSGQHDVCGTAPVLMRDRMLLSLASIGTIFILPRKLSGISGLMQFTSPGGDFFQICDAQRPGHPPFRAEHVDANRRSTPTFKNSRVSRGAPANRYFRDFQHRVDGSFDALPQFATMLSDLPETLRESRKP